MMPDGLCAFPITPADADGRVDVPTLRRLVARICVGGADSVGVLGSTGTYLFLTREERRRAVEAAVEAAGRVPVLAGVGALRTDEAVAVARDAKAAGAAAGLLAPVSYTPLGDEEVFEHFRAVAEDSGLPICVYDNPAATRFVFTPELVGRLSRVDGIAAVKTPAPEPDAAAERLRALRNASRPGFSIGVSVDWHAAAALLAGADAWYSVVAGLLPAPAAAIVRAARTGDAAEVARLDGMLRPLWVLFREFSSLRVMHAAAAALGLGRNEPPRPILPVPAAGRERLAAVLQELDALPVAV
ncbi:MAG: dihydrodipicolinate synthase family protein [Gluconacetobacter diazotrophicus]|nr:dihydrodipicolinate synthase family protein [Gluconacetobacter diazotrophicus]